MNCFKDSSSTSIKTGGFSNVGREYAFGSNPALLSSIARGAEELTSGKGWPEGVNDLLADLGMITGVSRVWIFQVFELTDDYILQDYTFEWAKRPEFVQLGMPTFSMFKTNIDSDGYRRLIESRKRGEWQKVITRKLPPCFLKKSQEEQGILSMLTISILVEGEWWGILGFDDCEREYEWSDVEIGLLRTAAFLISSAVLRDRLSAKRRQFAILNQLSDTSTWEYDFQTGHFWCSPELVLTYKGTTENLRFSLTGAMKLVHPFDRKTMISSLHAFLERNRTDFRQDVRILTDSGSFRWVELLGKLHRNNTGKPAQLAGIAVDISHRKMEEQRLLVEATTDPLTGIMNRRMLERELWKAIEKLRESGSGPLSVFMVDLDKFKNVNDTYGHHTGDLVLKNFAALCQVVLREKDIVGRLGGDEFCILLADTTSQEAECIGWRLIDAVSSETVACDNARISFSISLGMATSADPFITPTQLLDRADTALYNAKRSGRNRLAGEEASSLCFSAMK